MIMGNLKAIRRDRARLNLHILKNWLYHSLIVRNIVESLIYSNLIREKIFNLLHKIKMKI